MPNPAWLLAVAMIQMPPVAVRPLPSCDQMGIAVEECAHYCERCKKWWKRTKQSYYVSCAVAHPPGDCCHYMEQEIVGGGGPPPAPDTTGLCPVCGEKGVEAGRLFPDCIGLCMDCTDCAPKSIDTWRCPNDGLLFTAPEGRK